MKRMEAAIALPEVMFYPSQIRRKPFLDMLLSTLTTEPIQEVDNSIPDAVSRDFSSRENRLDLKRLKKPAEIENFTNAFY